MQTKKRFIMLLVNNHSVIQLLMRKLVLLLWVIIGGCDDHTLRYDSLSFEPTISTRIHFKFMNDHYEPEFWGEVDSLSKASSDVKMLVIHDSSNHFFVVDQMKCHSWIENDTLWIHISRSDGFTGDGLNIKIKDEKFTCIPFHSTDVIIPGERSPVIHIEKQKLTLNKKHFQIGDSLYGHLYVKAMADEWEKKYAMGYFRTKITGRMN